ncbi:BURP domain-containing protein 3 [Ananas comosus]|uniref:BURP domain-containing protein 3 n=1 Tax=Ananas comosus TaxID=4615 RepID=A0A199W1A9_ANACO|nr:BURP domain-containing protein 3 [Ananas comosus]
MVKMVGKDGAAVDAAAVCHADTAAWNLKHLAFQVLKVKPGTVPICHFLPQDHVVWTRRTKEDVRTGLWIESEKDFTQQPPAQELIARDLHDVEWKFKHIFRDKEKVGK